MFIPLQPNLINSNINLHLSLAPWCYQLISGTPSFFLLLASTRGSAALGGPRGSIGDLQRGTGRGLIRHLDHHNVSFILFLGILLRLAVVIHLNTNPCRQEEKLSVKGAMSRNLSKFKQRKPNSVKHKKLPKT